MCKHCFDKADKGYFVGDAEQDLNKSTFEPYAIFHAHVKILHSLHT